MSIRKQDVEQIETWLDGELDAGAAGKLQQRLADDATFAHAVQTLKAQREWRREALNCALQEDRDEVERLVTSVRVAMASEAIASRRAFPWRYTTAAAACLAVGLLVGIFASGNPAGESIDRPIGIANNGNVVIGDTVGTAQQEAQLAHRVRILDETGRVLQQYRFNSREAADAFLATLANLPPEQAQRLRVQVITEPF